MAGAAEYDWVLTRVLVLAGHPAATATLFAAACALAFADVPAVVVVVVEVDEGDLGLFELVRKTMRITMPAMTAITMVLRICLRRFFAFASWARRISLPAR
jgi:hypothetical protein